MIENVLNILRRVFYYTTLVKCKSSNGLNNSNIETCYDYLLKQIELIKPKLIVTLGKKLFVLIKKVKFFHK